MTDERIMKELKHLREMVYKLMNERADYQLNVDNQISATLDDLMIAVVEDEG